jgi:uncharacterized OsmC-like protein/esterase/lipase
MRFDFSNKNGETLSGRLDLPSNPPRGYALFVHCFTCSKDTIAANAIAKTLVESDIGVLRFDFTGLGQSEGEFANTNFSSNIQDLLVAYEEMSKKYGPPELLIGHSLGGAAVLKAATMLPEVKAVVTIGAPSSVEHITHLFSDDLDKIKQQGVAVVNLAGRKFNVKKQFLDDINKTEILKDIKNLKKALLILHSPIDNLVSIDHASEIFLAAKHPKSFISLDTANHLMTDKRDAQYAAEVIGGWVSKYLIPKEERTELADKVVVVKARFEEKFTQDIYTNKHHILSDEPRSLDGADLGMNPYDLLLASLGACTSMTMKMYADKKGIPVEGISVSLSHKKIHAEDCDSCEDKEGKIDRIEKKIELRGPLTLEHLEKLLEIAEKCPVNRTLNSNINIINI